MSDHSRVVSLLAKFVRFGHFNDESVNVPAFCPFHKEGQESSPSMFVYIGPTKRKTRTGDAFCFTCGEGWHLSGLLRKLGAGYKYIDSVKDLVAEPEKIDNAKRYRQLDLTVPVLPEAILGYYDYTPKALVDQGFDPELLKEYEVGFDRGNKRIVFPIRSHTGELAGISGRAAVDEMFPRYKIYKEELRGVQPGYELDKVKVLWGLDKFYIKATRGKTTGPVVVCEGFKATLWTVQCGIKNTVAIFGAYISPEQRLLLGRVTNESVLFLDNNAAGIAATHKAYEALSKSMTVRIAKYPKPKEEAQPDDLSKEEVLEAITNPLAYITWRSIHE
jgi:hypothetical protein